MEDASLEQRLAARIRDLRASRDLSLEQLAQLSGVSRSMISLIERAEASPTANVLDRLAASLGVTLAALFADDARADATPLARHADQAVWRDPETGYLRRNLSPAGYPSPIELVEVELPPRARVAYDAGARVNVVQQQVWLIEGSLEITLGDAVHRLAPGDCLAMRVDRPIAFRNPGRTRSRHLVSLTTESAR
jgi:transcriptional regulator with XRE-family HTH domain